MRLLNPEHQISCEKQINLNMFCAAAGGGSEDYSIMVQGLGRMFMGKDWENVHG